MFRITGKQADRSLSILAGHPFTKERPDSAAPLLTAQEWVALKAICTPDTINSVTHATGTKS